MMRIQLPSVLAAEIRVEVAMTPAWPCGAPCGPLAATVLISVAAVRLREAASRVPRGIGALAATILARSEGGSFRPR